MKLHTKWKKKIKKKLKKIMRENALFFNQKNPKLQNTKIRKNWIFSCLLCAYSKENYETSLWFYVGLQKNFHFFLTRSGYLKFCSKKFFPKKRLYCRNFGGKNFEKNWKIQIFGRSAEIGQIFSGDKNLCIRRICIINI